MEYIALYRKYRPCCLDEIYGQDYIVKIIKNSVLNNRFFHAYLFSGPRGTGKTTIARMLAKMVNCISINGYNPCDECLSCKSFNDGNNADIIEIDAASNNGVDEIRSIRDSIIFVPSVSKYKVYIIDEVHMLSASAFNALLKTLEEPPSHVIFILATTEFDKVPDTIVSRCQCYDFKPIKIDDAVLCLKKICEKEGLSVSGDVLSLISKYCNGGMRDSIGLLDKLSSYSDNIDEKLFYDVVGVVSEEVVLDFCKNILDCNTDKVFSELDDMIKSGKTVDSIVEQMLLLFRNQSICGNEFDDDVLICFLNNVSDISRELRYSVNKILCFEIGILKLINIFKNSKKIISREIISDEIVVDKFNKSLNIADSIEINNDLSDSNTSDDVCDVDLVKKIEKTEQNFDIVINNAFALANKRLKQDIIDKWNDFYDYVHNKEFSSIVSYFLDSTVQVVGEKDVIISASYESIVNNAAVNIAKLELLFNLVMGKSFNLAFVLDEKWDELKSKYVLDIKSGKTYDYIEPILKKDVIIEKETDDLPDIVKAAKNIFGDDLVEMK